MTRGTTMVALLLVGQVAHAEYRLIRSLRSRNGGQVLGVQGASVLASGGNVRRRVLARRFDPTSGDVVQLLRAPATDPQLTPSSMAVNGAEILIGATGAVQPGGDAGRAYLFGEQGRLLRTFLRPEPGEPSQRFGLTVAAAGSLVAVADPHHDAGTLIAAGAVYLFDSTSDSASDSASGALLATLTAPEPHAGDVFGAAIALATDRIYVGAPGDDSADRDAGAVHVFDRATGAWLARVVSPEPHPEGGFGRAIALLGEDLVVAGEVVLGTDTSFVLEGRVHRLDPVTGAARWTAVTAFPNISPPGALFTAGGAVVVGTPGQFSASSGLFTGQVELHDSTTGALLEAVANPSPAVADEAFGSAVAALGPYLVVTDAAEHTPTGTTIAVYWFVDDSTCGDGHLDPGESCDDGNRVAGDGCDRNCQPTGCANGEVTAGEECDLGDEDDTDFCDALCHLVRCGDGRQTPGESCDDGNPVDGDGCDSDCTFGTTTTTTRATTTSIRTTTTRTASTTTTTTLPVSTCAVTRHPQIGCVAETIARYQIDCAGELVTPQVGKRLDQLRELIARLDQAGSRKRARGASKKIGTTLGKARTAVRRAERTGALGGDCLTGLRALLDDVRTRAQAVVQTASVPSP